MSLKHTLILFFSIISVTGCVSQPRTIKITLSEAHRIATSDRDQPVLIAGFFFNHIEGPSLEKNRGEAGFDGLILRWQKLPVLEPKQPIAHFRGTFVEVKGVLRKASILGPKLGPIPYLEVHALKISGAQPDK